MDETSCDSMLPCEVLESEDVSLICDEEELSGKLRGRVVLSSLKKKKSSQEKDSNSAEEFVKQELRFWYWKKEESKSISFWFVFFLLCWRR